MEDANLSFKNHEHFETKKYILEKLVGKLRLGTGWSATLRVKFEEEKNAFIQTLSLFSI